MNSDKIRRLDPRIRIEGNEVLWKFMANFLWNYLSRQEKVNLAITTEWKVSMKNFPYKKVLDDDKQVGEEEKLWKFIFFCFVDSHPHPVSVEGCILWQNEKIIYKNKT